MRYIPIILAIILTVSGCKQQAVVKRNNKWFIDTSISFSQDRKEWMFPDRIHLRTTFPNSIYGTLSFTEFGTLEMIADTDIFGYPKCGKVVDFYTFKNRTRIYSLKFVDCNSKVTGPVFVYDKKGRLEHLYRFKNNSFDSIIYTRNIKEAFEDTIGIRIFKVNR